MNKLTETEADQESGLQQPLTLSPPELQYLSDKDVTETDPMLYLAWRGRNVSTFIQAAENVPGAPPFLQVQPLDIQSFQTAVVAHLSGCGGGSFPPSIVAPNTTQQYTNVVLSLRLLETSPWFQAVAAAVGAGGGPLADLYLVKDRRVRTIPERQNPVPPGPGQIQLFV